MSRLPAAALLPVLLLALAGCSGGDDKPDTEPSATAAAPSPPTPSHATAVPRPADRACYRLDFDAALAPTSDADVVDCAKPHTSITYAVGSLDAVVDGHLVAVDSERVQQQVARTCPERLAEFLGATPDDLHLSMLRAVWFTPSLEESDAGADWYRCDVIAVAADGELAPLTGRLAGVFSRPEARERYGMCGTDEPGTEAFSRVICSSAHSWRAIRTVGFPGTAYPGVDRVRTAGEQPCEDAARDRASDALDFTWGYEWPTEKQWDDGQTYGLCWAPD